MRNEDKNVAILAIESSCDDTGAAVWLNDRIASNVVANQEVHRQYGGVVPEVASRAHQQHLVPVVDTALKQAGITAQDLTGIAFTRGPGLIGSLMVGLSFAKSMALSLDIPLIEVHHMQAHVLAHFIEDPKPEFPFLCLTVSGGHTQIVLVKEHLDMEILGQSIDDAAGEAFDKTGKLLGLPYPAGPEIDRLAAQGTARFPFTEPQIKGLDFSFSGLKTSILYFLQKAVKEDPDFVKNNLTDICASVQDRIVSILLNKLRKASKLTGIKRIAIAGGVSANSGLRSALQTSAQEFGWEIYIPKFEYCTDNAAMIAVTAYYKLLKEQFADQSAAPLARWEL